MTLGNYWPEDDQQFKKATILQLTDSYSFRLCCFHPFQKELCNNDHLSSWRLCGEKRTELPLHTNLNAQVIEKTWKKGHLKTNPRWKKYAWICLAIHCFDGLPWLFGKFDHGASRTIHGSSPQFSARKPLICTKNSQDLAIPSKLSSIMVAPNLTYKCDCYSYLFVFVVWLFGMFHSGTSADG